MLNGTYTHSVDEKGRVVVPVKFKKELGLEFIITAGFDGSLMIMSKDEWKIFVARFDNLPVTKARRLRRYFIGNMQDASTDKQGRMQIPQQLRTDFGIEEEVVLVGSGNMVEVWPVDKWEQETNNLTSDAIIEEMDELVF